MDSRRSAWISIFSRKGGGHGGHSSSSGGHSSSSSSSSGHSSGDGGSSSSGSGKGSSSKPSSSGSEEGGGGSSGGKPASAGKPSVPVKSTAISSAGTRMASTYSPGGGARTTIPAGAVFAGRQVGGGARGQVFGTRVYGSGYPYGGYGVFVAYRPLPFGYWPLYFYPHYYGSDEYGPVNNASRPGGVMAVAPVSSPTSGDTLTYYLIGDTASVTLVLPALVANCSVANATVAPYAGTPNTTQVVQWYRASSFALALAGYDNAAAAEGPATNASAVAQVDAPLPAGLNATFLMCLNATIAAAVPLLDAPAAAHGLSGAAIAGIVVGSLVGLALLAWLLVWITRRAPRGTYRPLY